jgi:hypothetical protein
MAGGREGSARVGANPSRRRACRGAGRPNRQAGRTARFPRVSDAGVVRLVQREVERRPGVGAGQGVLAGVGAGVVAAAGVLVTSALLHARIPPPVPAAGSAFVAGILGGLVYAFWSRSSARPAAALWITALFFATVISLLVALLPAPVGGAGRLSFAAGLVVPLKQLLGLVGLYRFGPRGFPGPFVRVVVLQHYVTAVLVSLLVPRWARAR